MTVNGDEIPRGGVAGPALTVLCVDDNPSIADAVRIKLSRSRGLRFAGWLDSAAGLIDEARRQRPSLVLLDVDMPGPDPFAAVAELGRCCPGTRVVMFSGHVRSELVDRALESGAWGYVSKNDGEDELIGALESVGRGEVAFSGEVRATYGRG
jgi:DNA-binding NarL/FixJ family response regulator